jgi:hypothetical protein
VCLPLLILAVAVVGAGVVLIFKGSNLQTLSQLQTHVSRTFCVELHPSGKFVTPRSYNSSQLMFNYYFTLVFCFSIHSWSVKPLGVLENQLNSC